MTTQSARDVRKYSTECVNIVVSEVLVWGELRDLMAQGLLEDGNSVRVVGTEALKFALKKGV